MGLIDIPRSIDKAKGYEARKYGVLKQA